MVQNRSKTNNLIKIVSKINRVRDRVTRKKSGFSGTGSGTTPEKIGYTGFGYGFGFAYPNPNPKPGIFRVLLYAYNVTFEKINFLRNIFKEIPYWPIFKEQKVTNFF